MSTAGKMLIGHQVRRIPADSQHGLAGLPVGDEAGRWTQKIT